MSEKLKHIKDDEWEAIPNCQKCKAPICMCNVEDIVTGKHPRVS